MNGSALSSFRLPPSSFPKSSTIAPIEQTVMVLLTLMPWRLNQMKEGLTANNSAVSVATPVPNQRRDHIHAKMMVSAEKKMGCARAATTPGPNSHINGRLAYPPQLPM